LDKYNILFLCSANSARSIIGEVLANTHISRKFVGYSAGASTEPSLNPLAIEIADDIGYPIETLKSKHYSEFTSYESVKMDFIITVCDTSIFSIEPYWPGNPIIAQWRFTDPALVTGSIEVRRRAFNNIKIELQRRLDILASLPKSSLNFEQLQIMDFR